MPAIPYLVPEFVSVAAKTSVPHSGVHFPLFFLGLRTAGFSVFSMFSAFSGFQGSRSRIPVFPFLSAFSAFSGGSKSGIPVFPFFSAFWSSKPGIPGSRLRPRLVRPRLARTEQRCNEEGERPVQTPKKTQDLSEVFLGIPREKKPKSL